MNAFERAFKRVPEKYQRVHFYSFTCNANVRLCLSPNQARQPVRMFMIQADLANGGIINIADANVSLINGIQLDPGRAIQFSVSNEDYSGGLSASPSNFIESARYAGQEAKQNLFLDLADFFIMGDAAAQRVRVFWASDVK